MHSSRPLVAPILIWIRELCRIGHSGPCRILTFTYDAVTRQRLKSQVGPGVSTTYSYDAFGRESRSVLDIWGAAYVTDFESDLLDRTTKIVYPSANADVTYQYDGAHLASVCGRADGNCAAHPEDWFIDHVAYDSLGRPVNVSKQPGDQEYQYDAVTHQLTESQLSNGLGEELIKLTYAYDDAGNIETVVDGHTGVATDGLDASATYLYDHRNRLKQRTLDGDIAHFQYDSLGNLTGRDLAGPTAPANQLYADATRPHAITQRGDGATYAYDADGNAIRRGSQYLQYDWRNLPTCLGTTASTCNIMQYYYDADGHRIAELPGGGPLRILVGDWFEFVGSENTAEVHVYAFGERIATQRSENASLRAAWVPVSWSLPLEPEAPGGLLGILGTAGLLAWLTQSGAIALIRNRPATSGLAVVLVIVIATPVYAGGGGGSDWIRRWYHSDHLGSAVLVTNEAGDVLHRRVFEPFGKVIAATPVPTEPSDALFTGKELGAESGIFDFHARQYDADAGRFLSIDPIVQGIYDPQTLNPYAYVRNNPVSFTDPTGMFFNFDLSFSGFNFATGSVGDLEPPDPPVWVPFDTAIQSDLNALSQLAAGLKPLARIFKQIGQLVDFFNSLGQAVGSIGDFGVDPENPEVVSPEPQSDYGPGDNHYDHDQLGRVTGPYDEDRPGGPHTGTDQRGAPGDPAYAPLSGQVQQAGQARGYGGAVVIGGDLAGDGSRVFTVQGHINPEVEAGAYVFRGDRIGNVAAPGTPSFGSATAPHIHLGVYRFPSGADWAWRSPYHINPETFNWSRVR